MKDIVKAIKTTMTQRKWEDVKEVEKKFRKYLRTDNPYFNIDPKKRDLAFIFNLYDKHFFSELLSETVSVSFDLSTKYTKTPGMVKYSAKANEAKITVSIPLVFDAFIENHNGYHVNGIYCQCPIEAILRVLEHEIVHICEYIMYKTTDCSGSRFSKMAFELFAHTENPEKLGVDAPDVILSRSFKKGDLVTFIEHDRKHTGEIINITNKATVLVGDNYISKKYSVPLDMLRKVDESDL